MQVTKINNKHNLNFELALTHENVYNNLESLNINLGSIV